MGKYITFLIVLVLIAAGIGVLVKRHPAPASLVQHDQSSFTAVAAFDCDNGKHFIAEFPSADEVQIDIDGSIVYRLPRHSAGDNLFADPNASFTFSGTNALFVSGTTSVRCTESGTAVTF